MTLHPRAVPLRRALRPDRLWSPDCSPRPICLLPRCRRPSRPRLGMVRLTGGFLIRSWVTLNQDEPGTEMEIAAIGQ